MRQVAVVFNFKDVKDKPAIIGWLKANVPHALSDMEVGCLLIEDPIIMRDVYYDSNEIVLKELK